MSFNRHFSKAIFINNFKKLFFIPTFYFLYLIYNCLFNVILTVNEYRQYKTLYSVGDYEFLIINSVAVLASPVVIAFMSVITVLGTFSFMYNQKNSFMMHAFPQTRTAIYLTNIVTGILMLIVPVVITGVLLMPIAAGISVKGLLAAGVGMLKGVLLIIFFFGMALLVSMFTGSAVAFPVLYFLLNLLHDFIGNAYFSARTPFFFGVSPWEEHKYILSPISYLGSNIGVFEEPYDYAREISAYAGVPYMQPSDTGIAYIIVLAVIGIIFAAVGLYIYKNRNIEYAKETITLKGLAPIVRWSIVFIVSLTSINVGYYSLERYIGLHKEVILIYYIVAFVGVGLISFVIVNMLLKRSFRVFNKKMWLEYALMTLAFTIFSVCIYADPMGIEDRLPTENKLVSTKIQMDNYEYVEVKKDELSELITLQNEVIKNKDILRAYAYESNFSGYYDEDINQDILYYYLDIRYEYEDGKVMYRYYPFIYNNGYETDELVDRITNFINKKNHVEAYAFPNKNDDKYYFYNLNLQCYDNTTISKDDMDYGNTYNFDKTEQKKLYDALEKDVNEGNVKISAIKDAFAYIYLNYREKNSEYEYVEEYALSKDIEITKDCTNVMKALEDMGYSLITNPSSSTEIPDAE